jgi:hypothetical protein
MSSNFVMFILFVRVFDQAYKLLGWFVVGNFGKKEIQDFLPIKLRLVKLCSIR